MSKLVVCPRCGGTGCRRFGRRNGSQRWRCPRCRRTWNDLLGTPLFHLHTPLAEIVRTIRIVMNRGSLRAAEEQTGHNYDTIAVWLRRLGAHADAVTELLARDLALSEVEIDEFWSFVGKKGGGARRRGQAILFRPRRPGNTGVA
jgi:transposase-like protein